MGGGRVPDPRDIWQDNARSRQWTDLLIDDLLWYKLTETWVTPALCSRWANKQKWAGPQ